MPSNIHPTLHQFKTSNLEEPLLIRNWNMFGTELFLAINLPIFLLTNIFWSSLSLDTNFCQ